MFSHSIFLLWIPMKLFLLLILVFSLSYSQSLYIPASENGTLSGKVMFGYQGWFGHPNDSSPRPHFWHWRDLLKTPSTIPGVESWPDMREMNRDEKYSTSFQYPNGDMAPVFSSGNRHTVHRHIKWVRDYGLDGVFIQRFHYELQDGAVKKFRDSTTIFVKEASEKYGRLFAIMWDGINDADGLIEDWKYLVDELKVTESPAYLRHNGKPMISLWSYTFYDYAEQHELDKLIGFFSNSADEKYRASIKIGVNDNWFSRGEDWKSLFRKVDVISPWSVGRFANNSSYENNYKPNQFLPGKKFCDDNGILFMPVIWPGFSWSNLKQNGKTNEIPRNGGNFAWTQAQGAISSHVETIYLAMLDELDESTSWFKQAENASMSPVPNDSIFWLNLDADGHTLPSDWYLRVAGKMKKALTQSISINQALGTPGEGILTIHVHDDTCNDSVGLSLKFPDFEDADTLAFTVDNGQQYVFKFADTIDSTFIKLPADTFEMFMRYNDKSENVPFGQVRIREDCGYILQESSSSSIEPPNSSSSIADLSSSSNDPTSSFSSNEFSSYEMSSYSAGESSSDLYSSSTAYSSQRITSMRQYHPENNNILIFHATDKTISTLNNAEYDVFNLNGKKLDLAPKSGILILKPRRP